MKIASFATALSLVSLATLALAFQGCSADPPPPSTGVKDCAKYCNQIETDCKGENLQYIKRDTCLLMCNTMVAGTPGTRNTDTLACREAELSFFGDSKTDADRRTACLNGGPYSETCDSTGVTKSARCATFCRLNVAFCSGGKNEYTSEADCTAKCAKFPRKSFESGSPAANSSGDTLICRGYHLQAALQSSTVLNVHCPHTNVKSDQCFDEDLPRPDAGAQPDASGAVDSGPDTGGK
jgi:hypothetical protein